LEVVLTPFAAVMPITEAEEVTGAFIVQVSEAVLGWHDELPLL
jgi:hypothetical protein